MMLSTHMRSRRAARIGAAALVAAAGLAAVVAVSTTRSAEAQPRAGAHDVALAAAKNVTVNRAAAKAPAARPQKVIVDSDMGQLNDDAKMLFMLGQSPNVDLLGVTTVIGNTWQEEGTQYALRNLEVLHDSEVPVVPGANVPLAGDRRATLDAEQQLYGKSEYLGAYGHPQPTSYRKLAERPYGGYAKTKPRTDLAAAEFISEQVKKYPHQVSLFVIGPATNVALAVRTHPEIVPLVKQVIYMGGAIDVPGNSTPAAEFNVWIDPEAWKILIRTPFAKQTVVPLDVSNTVHYTKAIYDRVVDGPQTPITKEFEALEGPTFADDPKHSELIYDTLTAGYFLDPSIATQVRTLQVDCDTDHGLDYGRTLGYPDDRGPVGTQHVDVLYRVDNDRFFDDFVSLMRAPVS